MKNDADQGHFKYPPQSSTNTIKISTLKQTVHFSHAVQFLATFNVYTTITLALF